MPETDMIITPPSSVPLATTSPPSRWAQWQARSVTRQYLTPEGAAAGFTILKFTPSMTPAFFDLAALIIARSRLEGQLVRVLERDPASLAALQEALAAWTAWRGYTVQLARTFERLAQGHHPALPPIPDALQDLAAALALEETSGDPACAVADALPLVREGRS